jgi:putative transposase
VSEDVIRQRLRHTSLMRTSVSRYHRHRFPAEIISHCVWLYFRFALSLRDVEEMLAMRGVTLTYETVREWCLKFGQTYANDLRHKSPRRATGGTSTKCSSRSTAVSTTWRAVDHDGEVLEILVQSHRDQKAAKPWNP